MKSIKTTLAALLFTAAILPWVSCKKESTTPAPTPQSTQEKLLGKWKVQSIVTNDFYSGTSHITNYTGIAADYFDFRNDGKVYWFITNSYDTASYGRISDSKIWIVISTNIYDILALTDTQLKLYSKQIYNATEYYETTFSFFR